jgi:hypothetical protein
LFIISLVLLPHRIFCAKVQAERSGSVPVAGMEGSGAGSKSSATVKASPEHADVGGTSDAGGAAEEDAEEIYTDSSLFLKVCLLLIPSVAQAHRSYSPPAAAGGMGADLTSLVVNAVFQVLHVAN